MPYDLALLFYRQQMGLTWADLSGEWPQPAWRTAQDLWYGEISAEVAALRREPETTKG